MSAQHDALANTNDSQQRPKRRRGYYIRLLEAFIIECSRETLATFNDDVITARFVEHYDKLNINDKPPLPQPRNIAVQVSKIRKERKLPSPYEPK